PHPPLPPPLPTRRSSDLLYNIVAFLARRDEPFAAEHAVEAVEEGGRRLFVNAHGAIALHVAVPAHRAQARARAAHVAAQQYDVRSEEHTSELQSRENLVC